MDTGPAKLLSIPSVWQERFSQPSNYNRLPLRNREVHRVHPGSFDRLKSRLDVILWQPVRVSLTNNLLDQHFAYSSAIEIPDSALGACTNPRACPHRSTSIYRSTNKIHIFHGFLEQLGIRLIVKHLRAMQRRQRPYRVVGVRIEIVLFQRREVLQIVREKARSSLESYRVTINRSFPREGTPT